MARWQGPEGRGLDEKKVRLDMWAPLDDGVDAVDMSSWYCFNVLQMHRRIVTCPSRIRCLERFSFARSALEPKGSRVSSKKGLKLKIPSFASGRNL